MLQASLVSPSGRKFLREVHTSGRRIYSWAVSDLKNMDWCIRKGVDGVLTDRIPGILGLCESFEGDSKQPWPIKTVLIYVCFNFWVYLFGLIFRRRYGTYLDNTVREKKDQ